MAFPSCPVRTRANLMQGAFYGKGLVLTCVLVLFCLLASPALAENSVKGLYMVAENKYQELLKNPQKQKLRMNWKDVAGTYERAHATDPNDPWASAALYRAADTWLGLSKLSGWQSDKNEAISLFQKVERSYPKSSYKTKAAERLKELGATSETAAAVPAKTTASPEKKRLSPPRDIPTKKTATIKPPQRKTSGTPAIATYRPESVSAATLPENNRIQGLHYKTYQGHTRIVVNTSTESSYTYNDLKLDRRAGLPKRIYIDFKNATLAPSVKNADINDTQISRIRIAQNTPDRVRLVVDIKAMEDFNVFRLSDPNRIIMDVVSMPGVSAKTLAESLPDTVRETSQKKPAPQLTQQETPVGIPDISSEPLYKIEVKTPSAGAIRKQLALGVKRIVIDPGHGGRDPGAAGYMKGVREKDVNLQLAKKLAEKLKKQLGCEVLLTRDKDTYLTLESRTAFANNKKADLFISLHVNSSPSNKAHGIETYFLNLATDDEAIAVAARENATSKKNISDLQTILNDLMRNAKINESSKLASYVQRGMITTLKPSFSPINDKGVKQAPFYVLLGAHMPSILIETGFINNRMDCQRLTSARYQDLIVTGITGGIGTYIKDYIK